MSACAAQLLTSFVTSYEKCDTTPLHLFVSVLKISHDENQGNQENTSYVKYNLKCIPENLLSDANIFSMLSNRIDRLQAEQEEQLQWMVNQ